MKPDELTDWDTAPDGSIKTSPLIGWSSFVPFGMMCGLRLEFVHTEEQLVAALNNTGKPDAAQILLTPDKAEELAHALLKLAEAARKRPVGQAQ